MASALVISNLEQHRVMSLTTSFQLVENLVDNRSGVWISNPPGGEDIAYRILDPAETLPVGAVDTLGATSELMPDGYILAGQTIPLPCKETARVALAVLSGTKKVKVGELP